MAIYLEYILIIVTLLSVNYTWLAAIIFLKKLQKFANSQFRLGSEFIYFHVGAGMTMITKHYEGVSFSLIVCTFYSNITWKAQGVLFLWENLCIFLVKSQENFLILFLPYQWALLAGALWICGCTLLQRVKTFTI